MSIMMKKIFFVCLFAIFACTGLHADPIEDLTKEEAAALVNYLEKNPFLVDYCDCCDDLNAPENRVYAKLIFVEKAEIVPCSYNDEKVSVKITGTVVTGGTVNAEGVMEGVEVQGYAYENENGSPTLATLNYHFVYQEGVVKRLGSIVKVNTDDYKCNPLSAFPLAEETADFEKPYKNYLQSNRK
jgi:hypothetical protein